MYKYTTHSNICLSNQLVQSSFGRTKLTPPGIYCPDIDAPAVGTTLSSDEATPGLIRNASLITAVYYH